MIKQVNGETVAQWIKKLERREKMLKENLTILRESAENVQKELEKIKRTLNGLRSK
jgi:hypothetical protein